MVYRKEHCAPADVSLRPWVVHAATSRQRVPWETSRRIGPAATSTCAMIGENDPRDRSSQRLAGSGRLNAATGAPDMDRDHTAIPDRAGRTQWIGLALLSLAVMV